MAATTPLAAVGKGLLAGAAGTAAMTVAQTAVAKARGAESSTTPADIAKRFIRGVLQRQVSDDHTELLNNAMHWGYGTSWGAVYGVVEASLPRSPVRHGLAFGGIVWGASLVELPAMKMAPPVWKYPPTELALEVSYHLVYGLGVAAALAALRA